MKAEFRPYGVLFNGGVFFLSSYCPYEAGKQIYYSETLLILQGYKVGRSNIHFVLQKSCKDLKAVAAMVHNNKDEV